MLKSNQRMAASKQGNQKVQWNEQKVANKTKIQGTAASKQGNQKTQRNEQKVAKKTKMVENKFEQRKVISFDYLGRVILV